MRINSYLAYEGQNPQNNISVRKQIDEKRDEHRNFFKGNIKATTTEELIEKKILQDFLLA